jgi:polyphosphate kinase 2
MGKLKRKHYDELIEPLQEELVAMARWVASTQSRILILFEGRDTAGKGGAIQAVAERLNPRQCHTVAMPKPSDLEATQWYFQRYLTHLPAAGEIVLFDRSWYNRAGVEKVMGYASEEQVKAFFRQVTDVEKLLTDDGIILFKYWLCCDQEQQEERLAERQADPLKRWKLSPIDQSAREKYDVYTQARAAMLKASHTKYAPWTLVDFNDQKRGRLTLIRDLLDRLPDTRIDAPMIDLPPLTGPLSREHFDTLSPIAPFKD